MALLPFLKPNSKDGSGNASGVLTIERKPDTDKGPDAMDAAAQDILRAIESKDYKHLAEALRSAYQICESEGDTEIGEEGLE